jgi:RNA polymerase sigma factor (sigma-70 family)
MKEAVVEHPEVRYETLEFYLNTAKRAIRRWGHLNMLSNEDDISHVAYMIMRADQKFNGQGTIEGFRISYARYGVLRLISNFKKKKSNEYKIYSLDSKNTKDKRLHDYIEDKQSSIIDEIEIMTTEELVMNFDFITEQEKDCIIRNRLNRETLHTIGKELDLTRERIRQIIESGLAKLRRYYITR